jgi:hypothetical protein
VVGKGLKAYLRLCRKTYHVRVRGPALASGKSNKDIAKAPFMVRQNAMLARNILGEATWLIGMGTALGIIGAVIDAMLMRRLLFGVQWWDPPTLVATTFALPFQRW